MSALPAADDPTTVVSLSTVRTVWWVVGAVGIILLGLAVWMAVGPWTVHLYGQSYGCGSPFMGRYSHPADPMATASVACHLQASNRRTVALASGGVGVVVFVAGALGLLRSRHRRSDLTMARSAD